jgi:hypothetical protein
MRATKLTPTLWAPGKMSDSEPLKRLFPTTPF